MWTHLERTEGAIGTRGPGETQLETDRRLLNKRVTDLRSELKVIEARRMRQVRSRSERFTVGLVGYTNAGKSTLLNRLTNADELAADMLFATLDTRTRKWQLEDGRNGLAVRHGRVPAEAPAPPRGVVPRDARGGPCTPTSCCTSSTLHIRMPVTR